jgi:hypothetical protein
MAPLTRTEPDRNADERETLTAYLDYHRATIALKCEGLDDSQLRQRAVPPSNLSLLGLVRHLAEVERWWFQHGVAGEPVEDLWCTPDNPDGDFDDVAGADVAEAFTAWRAACDAARAITAERPLDATFQNKTGTPISLRWVLVHLVAEYARHNGHAALLRQALDGVTGE